MPNLMTDENQTNELLQLLDSLIVRFEYELVEFKEANEDYDKDKIGRYVSAISNEANLSNCQYGWLIFGVRNKDKKIVGSNYRDTNGLDKLRYEIAENAGGLTFMEIHELFPIVDGQKKRVIMFKIPATPTSIPTAWKGHYYSRNGESVAPLAIEKLERLRGQEKNDWSKLTNDKFTIDMLDKQALNIARDKYKEKMNKPHISEEIDEMNDFDFLKKVKLIIDGKITNAAMVLLGNSDYDYIFATPPTIMWRLYDAKGEDKAYEILKTPFITAIDEIFNKIRNLTYRYMPNQLTLFPTDTQQYDPWLLRELINNCIAHMDYTIGGRIYVNEFDDKIKFTNPGTFLPGTIEPVLQPSYNPPFYRNQLLAESMVKFNMIDTATMGIRKIFRIQKDKFFPLPDYDLSTANQVEVMIYGKVLNENYTKLLFNNPDYDLGTVYLIDKVQKRLSLNKDEIKHLRKLNAIEGKASNIFISANIAKDTEQKAQYVKNKGFDDAYYKDLIIEYLKNYKKATRADIRKLLFNKFPESLDETQKETKLKNMLYTMNKNKTIKRSGTNNRLSSWELY